MKKKKSFFVNVVVAFLLSILIAPLIYPPSFLSEASRKVKFGASIMFFAWLSLFFWTALNLIQFYLKKYYWKLRFNPGLYPHLPEKVRTLARAFLWSSIFALIPTSIFPFSILMALYAGDTAYPPGGEAVMRGPRSLDVPAFLYYIGKHFLAWFYMCSLLALVIVSVGPPIYRFLKDFGKMHFEE